jgi:hypothetical protein
MDRLVSQDGMDWQTNTVNVDLVFVAGASGAVPSTLALADGIAKVAKSGTTYVITLQDAYFKFLNVVGSVIQASPATAGASVVIPVAQTVASATPTVTIACLAGDGSGQVALASGDEIHVTLRLKR